jgi:hypothetical protein
MKEITLTQGKVALVDDEDYNYLNALKWHAHNDGYNFYAVHTYADSTGDYRGAMRMHRKIVPAKQGEDVDHIDGNGLNNQKYNLRITTHRQNCQNHHRVTSSVYPGVCWKKDSRKWQASIKLNGDKIHLGLSTDEFTAFKMYVVASYVLVRGVAVDAYRSRTREG